ncbi:hypothetical protein MP228_011190 [Amoeboaphelidium protococcarum]|nr:hypothetical protein MP228_011190 [Amoeboaphelidium protococcarum]
MSAQKQQSVRIDQLNPQQLQEVKQSVDAELQGLNQAYQKLQMAAARYQDSLDAIQCYSRCGQDVMIPLTSSLYIPAKKCNADKVMVDIGTGYFAEMAVVEDEDDDKKNNGGSSATSYFNRRVAYVKSQLEELEKVVDSKINVKKIVDATYSAKMNASQMQQQQ